jgi:hypothetical protein
VAPQVRVLHATTIAFFDEQMKGIEISTFEFMGVPKALGRKAPQLQKYESASKTWLK